MAEACDIAVIGAGAAGLAAGIFAAAAAPRRRVILLDGAARLGAKILVSGGGRCNVTHESVRPSDFQGPQHFVRHVLKAFDQQATVRWFASLGVALKREPTGKLFPVSDDSHTVLDALLRRCEELGVELRTSHRVHDVTPAVRSGDQGLLIRHEHGELSAARVIMATGGRSLPRTGSDGQGWAIASRLGHTVTPTYPALAPLLLAGDMFHSRISGLSLEATLSSFADGKQIDRRTGSLLFTHFGVSGPVAMDASRHWIIANSEGRRAQMRANLLPGEEFASLERKLIDVSSRSPRRSGVAVLGEMLPGRLAEALWEYAGLPAGQPMGQLTRQQRRQLVHAVVELELPVVRDRGWNYAEVTAGGVPLNEVDRGTMQSRRVPGLYLIGEMLDCDGRIGGFNFQWAWSTGYLAGQAAARSLADA